MWAVHLKLGYTRMLFFKDYNNFLEIKRFKVLDLSINLIKFTKKTNISKIFNYSQREYFSFRHSFELLLTINININRLLKQQYAKDK